MGIKIKIIVIRKFQNCLATYLELFFYPKVIIILLSINVIISTPLNLHSLKDQSFGRSSGYICTSLSPKRYDGFKRMSQTGLTKSEGRR